MKPIIVKLCMVLLFTNNLFSQDLFTNYKPIESSGTIPEEFIVKSSEKVEAAIDDFTSGEKGKTKRYKEDFLISSTFSTKKVLLSGKVLFNDPVTKYINKVADVIFKANKDLDKNDFRIYAYKSPIVNAFAFNDGLVLVNLGMIAQLENEAQLALILSHEFTHVVNNDAIELFLSSKEIDNGRGLYKNISYDDKMLYKSKYSQEKESTADLQGLEYFKNTNYSVKPINGVFDVLKYSYLPFDDIKFDSTYFENEYYTFPSDYKLAEINPISPDGLENEDEDEEVLRSHPGAEERREAALKNITIEEIKDKNSKVYIVSTKKEFEKIRNICRFEMPRMYLLYGYYEMAFYNAFLLENQGFENNIYLDKIKAKAIGQMTRKINNGDRPSKSHVREIEEDMQGESQQLYYFLNSLGRKKKEFNIFAVQYTYSILQKHPKDKELQKMFESIVYEMFEETNLKYSDFKKIKLAEMSSESKDSLGILASDSSEVKQVASAQSEKEKLMDEIRASDSKYNKIETKVKEEKEKVVKEIVSKKKDVEKYYEYGFAKYLADTKFRKKIKNIEKELKSKEDNEYSKAEQKKIAKEKKLNRSRGLALGINKIAVVNPLYIVIQNDENNLYQSEKKQTEYNVMLKKISKRSKLKIETIDVNNLDVNNSEAFKNAKDLNEWISEQFLFDETLKFSSIEKEKIKSLKNAYDTKYFLWTGVMSFKNKKHTFLYNLLFDIETGELLLKYFKDVRYNTNKNIIKSEVYHVFDQIKTKRK